MIGILVGLGSYVHWDRRLDGRIAPGEPLSTLMRPLGSVDLMEELAGRLDR